MFSLFLKSFLKDFVPFFLIIVFFFSFLAWFIFFISGITLFLSSPLNLLEYFLMEIKEFPFFLELTLPFSWVFSLTYSLFKFNENKGSLIIEQAAVSLIVLKRPLILFSFFIILFLLFFSEFVTFPLKNLREKEQERFLGVSSEKKDFLFFVNQEENQILIANGFNFEEKSLKKVLVIFLNSQKEIINVIKTDSLKNTKEGWIFGKGFSWKKEGSFWRSEDFLNHSYPLFSLDILDLFFKGKNWLSFSFFELISFLRLNLDLKKGLAYPLLYEILFRLSSFLFYPLAIFWSFNMASFWEKTSFLLSILTSLSFNFLYTMINLILLNLASLKLLSFSSFVFVQLLLIMTILFFHKLFCWVRI